VHGDTDKVQFGMGTYGSRSGAVGMSAIVQSARQGRGQGQEDRRTM
jgi:carbon-monoxide dehydrogenase large subunit